MHSRAPPQKPAGKDSGIVQHQAVTRPQKLRQVAEHAILPALSRIGKSRGVEWSWVAAFRLRYELPPELIAQAPLENRAGSRMLWCSIATNSAGRIACSATCLSFWGRVTAWC